MRVKQAVAGLLAVAERLESRRLLSGNPNLLITEGGTGFDAGTSVATDGSGNIYVAGPYSEVVNFNPNGSTPVVMTSQNYSLDIFVAKYSPSGDLDWVKSMGGPGYDTVGQMVMDSTGNLYVTGWFSDTATFGSTQLTSEGSTDAYVVKLDSSGDILWAISMGTSGAEEGRGLAVDNVGDVYVTGTIIGEGDFDVNGSTVFNAVGSSSSFLVKLDAQSGSLDWGEELGGGYATRARDVVADAEGVYVTGGFDGTESFDLAENKGVRTSRGLSDGFLAKYNPSGQLDWVRQMGGPGVDRARSVALDSQGNVLISGIFRRHATFSGGGNSAQLKSAGESDIFVAKFTAGGTFDWVQSIGGPGMERPRAIAVDSSDNVYVVGGFHDTAIVANGAASLVSRGGFDSFVAEFDSDGGYVTAQSWGGVDDDLANGVAVSNGMVYITGVFAGTANFNSGDGVDDATSNGEQDIYILTLG
ncbi:MAG TPA: SBBP repeat-containing protein [Tepidisphaeraceae bacterium]|nr:SBBP repeat-containing protein [Tepidisphaeraceae bacterium]